MSEFESWDQILDNATLGVHIVNSDGIILWANKAELAMLRYGPDSYFRQSIKMVHADDDVIERILNILSGGGALHAYPARLWTKDGDIKFVLINSNVYRENDEFVHTRCFTTEITKAVYEQLRLEQSS